MKGNIRFNIIFGAVGLIFTTIISASNNLLTTSLLRGLIAFVVWFLLAFAVRWVFGILETDSQHSKAAQHHSQTTESDLGSRLDLTTPDESGELNELLKSPVGKQAGSNSSFKPLTPPKLISTASTDPEELAKAVRHLTEN
ncbi:hypothetical protein PASE110613_06340 [Paenibacillus sediminis]|uniref:Energy-coupling factor transporter transmembrane protein EcfT n=1 Tax=Paenibacillus sediminis TaxID=664909 RepID=A0ABS4H2Q3_9BACL|nr:hypothetical protein [Paenibacillus sediminis]MBP1936400.1 energy-coupling factor transporter transmembrane protein EcfT [Paenibacillus sediminis]